MKYFYVFQDDSVLIHITQSSTKCFTEEETGVNLKLWPSQSQALNPIKHLWKILINNKAGWLLTEAQNLSVSFGPQ